MAQFQTQELDYMADDHFDMADFDDNPFEDSQSRSNTALDDSVDSDFEDDLDQSNSKTDTSAAEARNGKDMQGIPWERLTLTRDEYRKTRLKQYKNFESLSRSREDLEKEYKPVQKGSKMYEFQFNTRLVKSTIVHFQIPPVSYFSCHHLALLDLSKSFMLKTFTGRPIQSIFVIMMRFGYPKLTVHSFANHTPEDYTNLPNVAQILLNLQGLHLEGATFENVQVGFNSQLYYMPSWVLKLYGELRNLVWATSKHDVYLMQNYSLMHWSSLLRRGNEVVNVVANPISPTLKYPGSSSQTLSRVQISTMAIKDNLVVAGGFHGELICKYLNQRGVAFCTKVATDENDITNTVDIYHSSSGSTRVVTANNDAQVRVFDGGNFVCLNRFSFPWSVNNTSVSPDGKSLAVLGDSAECLIADAQSGQVLSKLKGHLDYSFSSAWHPDGRILATGNQDKTCRLWDVRKLSDSLAVLEGRMGAIRGIRFTSDGRFMAMAEPADFVHIFDTKSDYCLGQEIDLFGEIAGISFSPDTEALFIGIADRTYGSLLEFNRRHHNPYLDYMF